MTRIAGSILLVMALPILFVGLSFLLYAIAFNDPCAPNAPVCRSSWPTGFLLAAVVLAAGVVHLVAGVGLWRRRRWAQAVGLIVSIGALAFSASLIESTFTVRSFSDVDPTRPGLEPNIDTNGRIATVAMALAYGVSTALLLLDMLRRRRPTELDAAPTRHTT
jgi:uncharacterized membrane protein YeiB